LVSGRSRRSPGRGSPGLTWGKLSLAGENCKEVVSARFAVASRYRLDIGSSADRDVACVAAWRSVQWSRCASPTTLASLSWEAVVPWSGFVVGSSRSVGLCASAAVQVRHRGRRRRGSRAVLGGTRCGRGCRPLRRRSRGRLTVGV